MRGLNNMKIISWNVQNGIDAYGDNKVSQQFDYLIKQDAEVVVLQEVDNRYMDCIENSMSNYSWHFSPALNFYQNGEYIQFGNAIGCKKGSAIQWRAHTLLPTVTDAPQHMTRSVGELVVDWNNKPVRVLTCHLEFYCEQQRNTQIAQIENIVNAAETLKHSPSGATEGLYKPLPLPVDAIICGDFNFPDSSSQYQTLFNHKQIWRDLAADNPEPTCGIFDSEQWENGADRRDFFFTNSSTLKGSVKSDVETSLSDHQPIVLNIESL